MKLPFLLSSREKQKIIKNSASYSRIQNDLFYIGLNLVIQRCVREDETFDILKVCHDEPCGGHFEYIEITYNILFMGYYWPTLFKDAQ